jgi:hypothetical protein
MTPKFFLKGDIIPASVLLFTAGGHVFQATAGADISATYDCVSNTVTIRPQRALSDGEHVLRLNVGMYCDITAVPTLKVFSNPTQ